MCIRDSSTAVMFRKLDEIVIANRPDSDAMAKALEIGDLAHICLSLIHI